MMSESLFERLGGTEGITKIADTLVDIHMANPTIAPRYAQSDVKAVKNGAATFFITGTGGPAVYEGKDMLATHKGMNISGAEFLAVLDDAMEALDKNGIGQREKEEVLYVLYSMKGDIVGV
ncbi:MAG: group 1 truncated hemoglobin [Alphaproteobacteria bacterium]|nr:MAG: group 1 truncated hemoglobin [Alphaproteobacteria bacterium]